MSVGDAAVYMGQPVQTGTALFSPYLDDRLGCVILLKTMELAADSPNDLYFVFTVQEEVGLCGAHTAAHGIVPDTGSRWTLHVRTMFPEAGIRFPRRWERALGSR